MSKKVKQLEAQIADLERKLERATKHIPRVFNWDVLADMLLRDEAKPVIESTSKTSGLQITREFRCPTCQNYLPGIILSNYCSRCGQHLDWSAFTKGSEDNDTCPWRQI